MARERTCLCFILMSRGLCEDQRRERVFHYNCLVCAVSFYLNLRQDFAGEDVAFSL